MTHALDHIRVTTLGRTEVLEEFKTHAMGDVHVSCLEKRERLEMLFTPAMNPTLVDMEVVSRDRSKI